MKTNIFHQRRNRICAFCFALLLLLQAGCAREGEAEISSGVLSTDGPSGEVSSAQTPSSENGPAATSSAESLPSREQPSQAMLSDLETLAQSQYDTVFFSMFPIVHYGTGDYSGYSELPPVLSTEIIPDLSAMADYLETALSSGNYLYHVCLGLDPWQIRLTDQKDGALWDADLKEHLLSYIEAYSWLSFDVLLAYPSIEHWCAFDEAQAEEALGAYRDLVSALSGYGNVTIFYVGSQPWLNSNPGNYESAFQLNDSVSQLLVRLTFCDRQYTLAQEAADDTFRSFSQYIRECREHPVSYPDLSSWQLVYFGDSIFGNYSGSLSIPGVVQALTGCESYNYAIGNTQAAISPDPDYHDPFHEVVENFHTGQSGATTDGLVYPFGTEGDGSHRLCFIINYGVNDYFRGTPMANPDDPYDLYTYTGAMRSGIETLKAYYPDALILILTPAFCTNFNNGTDIVGETGSLLSEYVAQDIAVASSEGVLYVNVYEELGVNEANSLEYLVDTVHFGEAGRFLYGTFLARKLQELLF